MKTEAELLAILDEAVFRHEGFNWAPMRPSDLDAVSVLVRDLRAQLAAAEARACHCELPAGFALEAHLSVPSRDKPLLAAAGVNIVKAATAALAGT